MSLTALNSTIYNLTLDGLVNIDADTLTVDGKTIDATDLVPYSGAIKTVDLANQNIKSSFYPVVDEDLVNLFALQNNLKSYVKFVGSTMNTNLGTYGLSAGSLTANSSLIVNGITSLVGNITASSNLNVSGNTSLNSTLNVGGTASLTNLIRTELNNVLSGYSPSTITVGNNFGTITNAGGVYQSTSSAVFASLVLGTLTVNQQYSVSLSLKSVDTGNNTNLYLYGSTTPNMTGQTGSLVAFTIPPNTTTFTTFTNTITFPAGSTYLLLVYYSQKPSGIDTLYWNQFSITGMGSVIKNLITPLTSLDGANKLYVDNTISSASSLLVPYTGATTLLNLGANSLTASTARFTSITSATPALALGVDVSGNLNTFTVPSAVNLLPLNNTWTGTNQFNNNVSTGLGYTTDLNGVIQTKLNSLGFTSASFTTAGITGTFTPPLGTITNPSGTTYQITQTAQGRSIMAISGFTPSVQTTYVFQFNIKCTVGTAVLSVEQDNILRSPQYYQLSTNYNTVIGTFYYDGTPNTIIFKIYTGVLSWNAQWDSFTLSTYSADLNYNMTATGPTRFIQSYNATAANTTTLVNRQTMDSAIAAAATPNLLPLNNIWTGTNTYNNGVQIAAGSLGVATGNIVKQSATATSFVQITGGNATNSPYMEFYFNGTRRSYIGNANATDMFIAAENGAQLSFDVGGSRALSINTNRDLIMNIQKAFYMYYISGTNHAAFNTNASGDLSIYTGTSGVGNRFTVKADGTTTHTSGDNSYMRYGPNGTWNAYLTVGATPDRSGASNAQVISTNGNLHLDAGNSLDIYYGYYPNSRGAPNVHRWYGTTYVMETIPQNTSQFSHVMCLDGNTLRRSQCVMRQYFKNESIAWTGGGFNYTYAFYKYNAKCPVRISGRYSYYTTSAGSTYVGLRIYSQSTGAYYYYSFHHFQNISYAHTTYPLDMVFYGSDFPTTGWFDTYIYNAGGPMVSDGNDQLQLNCMVLPVDSF